MKLLRTPDERFADIPGYPFTPHYTTIDTPQGVQARIHHVAEGPEDGPTVLLMHGQPTWSYLYRHMIPLLADAGLRVIAPDLMGYGRSDKPAAREDYSYQNQVDWMNAWLRAMDLNDVTFFGQDWGGLIGLRVVCDQPERFRAVIAGNTALPEPASPPEALVEALRDFRDNAPTPTMMEMQAKLQNPDPQALPPNFAYWQKWCWETEDFPVALMMAASIRRNPFTEAEAAAYAAPFPDPTYMMGIRAMPSQVPIVQDEATQQALTDAWSVMETWDKPFLCTFTDDDPVTAGRDQVFLERVPGTRGQPHRTLTGGGHFLQEGNGEELAEIIVSFVRANT